MERKGSKDKDLIPAIGSKTTVSLIFNRKRAFTIDMIRKRSETLGLPVEVLIQRYQMDGKQEIAKQENQVTRVIFLQFVEGCEIGFV